MYRLLFVLAFSLAGITAAHAASEPPLTGDAAWKEYQKLLENYYFLDKQKAGHISCRVSVPQIQEQVDFAHQKSGVNFPIDENLRDFSVTYDRKAALSFKSPHFISRIRPGAQLPDRTWAENALKNNDESFAGAVTTVEGIIEVVVKYGLSPAPQKYKNLSLIKNGDTTAISFDNGPEHINGIYSGTSQQITVSSPTFPGVVKSYYKPLNGKLALTHMDADAIRGSTKKDATYSISYQDLGSAFFPAQILASMTITEGTQQKEPMKYEIDFKNCTASDVSP